MYAVLFFQLRFLIIPVVSSSWCY